MENRKSLLFGKNIFAEAYRQFDEETFFQRLEGQVKPQSYFHKYKDFKNTILILSYVFNLASMLTASYAIFWLTNWITGIEWIAYIVGATFLFFLEKIKRKSSNELFRVYFFHREITKGWLILSVFCLAISLLSSGFGTKTGTEQLSPDAELLAADSTATAYRAKITKLEEENGKMEKQRDHKGIIYYRLQSVIKNNKAMIVDYNSRILELDKKLVGKNDLLTTNYQNQVHQTAWILVVLTIIVELLFEVCIAYIWYYNYRSIIERKVLNSNPLSHTSNSTSQKNDSLKDLFKQLQTEASSFQENDFHSSEEPHPSRTQEKIQGFTSLPIGFYTDQQRKDQMENLFKQQKQTFRQDFLKNKTRVSDLFTVPHKDFKTGEIRHVNFGNIKNMIGIYINRVEEAQKSGNIKVLKNRLNKLQYWLSKGNELKIKLTYMR